ncbi:MAG: YpuI family protein [Bacillus sp. (in: firmicutes)]
MGNSIIKTQLEEVNKFLESTMNELEHYVNNNTLASMQAEQAGDERYYKSLLSNLRRLEVYSAEGYEACRIILSNESFHKGAAEKTLYRIYHQCVNEFFSPKNDAWYEDSRSAYTGKNSIKFHQEVPQSLAGLIKSLEGGFQRLREDLEYYETDYRTKMLQSK